MARDRGEVFTIDVPAVQGGSPAVQPNQDAINRAVALLRQGHTVRLTSNGGTGCTLYPDGRMEYCRGDGRLVEVYPNAR